MEQDKHISLGDSYIQIEGDEKEVLHFIDDVLNGKINMELSTKSLSEFTVKIKEKETEKYLKQTYCF